MRYLIVLIILFCFSSCMNVSTKHETEKRKEHALVFEQDTLHLNTLHPNDTLSNAFLYVNNSGHSVKIINVATSCGCTKPLYDTNSINSGQSGEIKFSFKAGKDSGMFLKTIVVETNSKPHLKVLYLKGYISSN